MWATLEEKIKDSIHKGDAQTLKEIIKDNVVGDIVNALEQITHEERVQFFKLTKSVDQTEIFADLDIIIQEELVAAFDDNEIREIVGELYTHEVADLIEQVPDELASRIMGVAIDNETKDNINKLLKFTEDQTGSVMFVDFVKIKQNWTAAEALEQVRSKKDDARIGHYLFCVDSKDVLTGYIALEDLIFNKPTEHVKAIQKPVTSVYTTTHKEEAAKIFADNDMSMLPVVNANNQLVGIIAADDIIDVISESIDEDIHKQAGIIPTETSYSQTSILKSYWSRIVWLLILMLATTISSICLNVFEGQIDKKFSHKAAAIVSSAIFIIVPVVMGTAGNAGGQASTLIIRSLATGDITTKDYMKVAAKELVISSLVGVTVAIANALRLIAYYAATKQLNQENGMYWWLILSSSFSLLVVIIFAKTVGSMIPILAKTLKLDPALLSGPIITSIVDAVATIILFSLSTWILLQFWNSPTEAASSAKTIKEFLPMLLR